MVLDGGLAAGAVVSVVPTPPSGPSLVVEAYVVAESLVVAPESIGGLSAGGVSAMAACEELAAVDAVAVRAGVVAANVCTTTGARNAESVALGTLSRRVAAWITTAVANAEATAIIAMCAHVNLTARRRLIMAPPGGARTAHRTPRRARTRIRRPGTGRRASRLQSR